METPTKTKTIEASYTSTIFFQVPNHWDVKDVMIKWDNVYYKGKLVEGIKSTESNCDYKYPSAIEDADDMDYLFDED